jgi:thiol-disulfide isomerase/thioredoxin
MNVPAALIVIAALVATTTLLGVLARRRSGRVRPTAGARFDAGRLGPDARLGTTVTVVQFSTEYCGPCRVAERVLSPVVSERPGVHYLDVDLGERPHLAAEFGIVQTPTVLLLDAAGRIRSRIRGVPRAVDVAAQIDEIVKENHVVA